MLQLLRNVILVALMFVATTAKKCAGRPCQFLVREWRCKR